MKVSVIIAAKHEETLIRGIVESAKPYADEVVVVCDDPADPTIEAARGAGAGALVNTSGRGKGRALRFAVDRSDSDVIVFMDADGSHRPSDIPALVAPIREGRAELVLGSRLMPAGGSEELGSGLGEKVHCYANHASAFLTNRIAGTRLADVHNGFRAIRTDMARALRLSEPRFAIEPEMVIGCARRGGRVLEVPTFELRRQHGESRLIHSVQFWDCLHCYWKGFRTPRSSPPRG